MHHHPDKLSTPRNHSHAHTNFYRAIVYAVCHCAVETCGNKQRTSPQEKACLFQLGVDLTYSRRVPD
jgi:hypothetical protein